MIPLPTQFVERILHDLGVQQGEALCAALDTAPPTSVRLNPAKPACRLSGEPVPWSASGLYLTQRPQFTLDSDFHAGAYYVQEASSQFVGHLLSGVNVVGCRLLDMCAAPGGKTTLYASLVGSQGLVVANEIDRRRGQVLADNVRKWGMGNTVVTVNEPRHLAQLVQWFDVVAVDAPCSGEGMFRKDEQARQEWSQGNVHLCAARQTEILHEAWAALRAGGTLIYSTCTFNQEEDEQVLEELLRWAGEAVVEADEVPLDAAWGVVDGRLGAFRTYRFYPHRTQGEGFFVALARKAHDAGGRPHIPKPRRVALESVDGAARRELSRWLLQPETIYFAKAGDTYYGYFAEQAEAVKMLAERLSLLTSGVPMGQIFKGVLKPDPALAFFCGLNRQALPVTELEGEELLQFLRRQEVSAERFVEGMNLVCAQGQALGFVKRIGGRVNNMYPNSLRIINK